jgi:hypothetical protein
VQLPHVVTLAAPPEAVLSGLTAASLWSMRGPLTGPATPDHPSRWTARSRRPFAVRHEGRVVARVDFGYPEQKLAIEYDGAWHGERDQFTKDRARLNRLLAAGWRVLFVTAATCGIRSAGRTDRRGAGRMITSH